MNCRTACRRLFLPGMGADIASARRMRLTVLRQILTVVPVSHLRSRLLQSRDPHGKAGPGACAAFLQEAATGFSRRRHEFPARLLPPQNRDAPTEKLKLPKRFLQGIFPLADR